MVHASVSGVDVEIPPFGCLGSNFLMKDNAWWVV